jgi:hypothetical protein
MWEPPTTCMWHCPDGRADGLALGHERDGLQRAVPVLE